MKKIKKQIVWNIMSMSEDMDGSYDKPGMLISGGDYAMFAGVFKGISSQLRLRKRIKVADAIGLCDALRKIIILE